MEHRLLFFARARPKKPESLPGPTLKAVRFVLLSCLSHCKKTTFAVFVGFSLTRTTFSGEGIRRNPRTNQVCLHVLALFSQGYPFIVIQSNTFDVPLKNVKQIFLLTSFHQIDDY